MTMGYLAGRAIAGQAPLSSPGHGPSEASAELVGA